jgi:hypothetical protein
MSIFYKVFPLAFDIKIYLTNKKLEVYIMKIIKFLAKHWVCTLILVTVIFAVVLPNFATMLQSGVVTWIESLF